MISRRIFTTHRPWYRRIPDWVRVAFGTVAIVCLVVGSVCAIAAQEPELQPHAEVVLLGLLGLCAGAFAIFAILALLGD